MEEAIRLLRETSLFAGIDATAAEQLARRLVRKRYRRGQPIFHQGDPGDALYILIDGAVAVVMSSEDGDRMVLATLRPPDVLGEIALLDGGLRSAGAEAVEETEAYMLSRATFLDLIREHPPLVDQLLRALGALVRRLSEQASDFVFLDLPGRVAKVLLRLAAEAGAEHDGAPLEITVNQARLAEMAGGSRQSINQILQGMSGRGWIEIRGRQLLICAPGELRRRAGLTP